MDIFEKRDSIQPYEYPQLLKYVQAIHESFWTPDHFTYDRDISDFLTKISEEEREVLKRTMLAIGVVENKVKTFWARIDMRMPKTEIAMVGHTFAGNECHVEGTEVLTPRGWVDFRNLKVGDVLYQYNINDSTISKCSASDVVKYPFDGELITFKNQRVDAIVTPTHRMIYKTESGTIKEDTAENFNFHSNKLFPKSGRLSDSGVNTLSPLDRLKIAIQADGTRLYYKYKTDKKRYRGEDGGYSYAISVKKELKQDRLRKVLKETDISYKEIDDKRKGYKTFKIRINDDFDLKTFDWVDLSDKSSKWCEEFVNELLQWDGYIKGNKKLYINTSKACIDVAQVVGILAGFRTHISKSEDNRKESYKTRYSLSFKDAPMLESSTLKSDKVGYNGYVYCATVDTGMLITRYNDRVLISGNCIHQMTYEKLLNLLGLGEEFSKVNEIPCMEGRGKYLGKYLQGVYSKSNKEFTKSLILFTLLVENASLFSQFLIVSSFKKYKNLFANFNSVISATAREETIHAKFGIDLINIIRKENPEWFDEDMERKIIRNIEKAFIAETEVLDWIFEKGELSFLSKESVAEYLKYRFNDSLTKMGYKELYTVDEELLAPTEFLDVQILSTSSFDFFNEKSTDYSQNTAFNEDDIWE